MKQLTAVCYKCNRNYTPPPAQMKAWAESGRDFDPTDWECGTCQAAEAAVRDQSEPVCNCAASRVLHEKTCPAAGTQQQAAETCPWRIPDDPWSQDNGQWETGCGNVFEFFVDGPKENGFRFCPYCKKPIEEAGRKEGYNVFPRF